MQMNTLEKEYKKEAKLKKLNDRNIGPAASRRGLGKRALAAIGATALLSGLALWLLLRGPEKDLGEFVATAQGSEFVSEEVRVRQLGQAGAVALSMSSLPLEWEGRSLSGQSPSLYKVHGRSESFRGTLEVSFPYASTAAEQGLPENAPKRAWVMLRLEMRSPDAEPTSFDIPLPTRYGADGWATASFGLEGFSPELRTRWQSQVAGLAEEEFGTMEAGFFLVEYASPVALVADRLGFSIEVGEGLEEQDLLGFEARLGRLGHDFSSLRFAMPADSARIHLADAEAEGFYFVPGLLDLAVAGLDFEENLAPWDEQASPSLGNVLLRRLQYHYRGGQFDWLDDACAQWFVPVLRQDPGFRPEGVADNLDFAKVPLLYPETKLGALRDSPQMKAYGQGAALYFAYLVGQNGAHWPGKMYQSIGPEDTDPTQFLFRHTRSSGLYDSFPDFLAVLLADARSLFPFLDDQAVDEALADDVLSARPDASQPGGLAWQQLSQVKARLSRGSLRLDLEGMMFQGLRLDLDDYPRDSLNYHKLLIDLKGQPGTGLMVFEEDPEGGWSRAGNFDKLVAGIVEQGEVLPRGDLLLVVFNRNPPQAGSPGSPIEISISYQPEKVNPAALAQDPRGTDAL